MGPPRVLDSVYHKGSGAVHQFFSSLRALGQYLGFVGRREGRGSGGGGVKALEVRIVLMPSRPKGVAMENL